MYAFSPVPDGFSALRPVISFAQKHLDGDFFEPHEHSYNQLIYADSGLVRVRTEIGSWTVPPQRAVWIPAHTIHDVLAVGAVDLRAVCVFDQAVPWLSNQCLVVEVSNLLRALINELVPMGLGYMTDSAEARLVGVFLDQLNFKPLKSLHLPIPQDPRARHVVDCLLADPSDRRTLADWEKISGGSTRTLSRIFVRETGMNFREWRLQLHMHEALAKLANNERVTEIAYDLGYNSPSAFIAIFRKLMGATPGQYMRQAED